MFRFRQLFSILSATAVTLFATSTTHAGLKLLGTHATGVFDESAAEIVKYDPISKRLFYVNANDATVDILSVSSAGVPSLVTSVSFSSFGGGANSVAVHDGIIAVAVEGNAFDDPGTVVFMDADGNILNSVTVGVLPDMVIFTPDGNYVLTANEGQPNDDYTVDPEGSVSVVDISGGISSATVSTASFTAFNGQEASLRAQGVRIFGPGSSAAQDFEPEYIAVSGDSETAYVALQENNAWAIVDIPSATVTSIVPLGYKNHAIPGNGLDASNRDDAINIRTWPVLGMYQPDAIQAYEVNGRTFIVSANEGDSRDYDGFSEEERVADLTLDPTAYPNAAWLQLDENLGRLKTTNTLGDTDGDGDVDQIYAYGGRSFSIWDHNGRLVYDSGDVLEQLTARFIPDGFNATNDENGADDRSDDKGPEPEAVEIATIEGRSILFLALERVGGVAIFDITDPFNPFFLDYSNNRDLTGDDATTIGDLGPESLAYLPRSVSPTGGRVLVTSNEVSGTVSLFRVAIPASPRPSGSQVTATVTATVTGGTADVVEFARSVAGRRTVYQWWGETNTSGIAEVTIAVAGRRSASGIYTARALDASGNVIDTWRNIPVNAGQDIELTLAIGGAVSVHSATSALVADNYPNPFNPQTQISFFLPTSGRTSLKIYNALGQEIRTLRSGFHDAGNYRVTWDGRNGLGESVASGVYLYRLTHPEGVVTRRMTLSK